MDARLDAQLDAQSDARLDARWDPNNVQIVFWTSREVPPPKPCIFGKNLSFEVAKAQSCDFVIFSANHFSFVRSAKYDTLMPTCNFINK